MHIAEYWDTMSLCFKDCILDNAAAHERLTNWLVGLNDLVVELGSTMLDVKDGLAICDKHEIYNVIHLLHTKNGDVKSINGFVDMGFTQTEAENIFSRKEEREALVHYYTMTNLKGTFNAPQNLSILMKDLRLKHYVKRDGLIIGLSGLVRIAVRGANYALEGLELGYIELLSFKILNYRFIYNAGWSDFIVAAVLTAIQVGTYSLQLWYGDITLRQFLKAICVSLVSIGVGCGGAAAGMLLGYALVTIIGGPVTAGIGIGAILGGVVAGCSAEAFVRRCTEKFFPDGDEQEINAQRKWYLNALKVFNGLPDSSFDNIKRNYYLLALANHPDKCPDKETATAKFQSIVVAYEIVKSYHEVLNESCDLLDMKLKDVNVDVLKKWKKDNTQTPDNNKTLSRAYYIVYRHFAFTSDNWKDLRAWLDGDQKLSLEKPVLAITTAK